MTYQFINSTFNKCIKIVAELSLIFLISWLLAVIYVAFNNGSLFYLGSSQLGFSENKSLNSSSPYSSSSERSTSLHSDNIKASWVEPGKEVPADSLTQSYNSLQQPIIVNCPNSSDSTSSISRFITGGGAIVLFFSRPIARFGDFISTILGVFILRLFNKIF